MKFDSAGPVITTIPEAPEISAIYEQFELRRYQPSVYPFGKEIQVFDAKAIPNPKEVSSTLPDIVGLLAAPVSDPSGEFDSFVRGVACVALLIATEQHSVINVGIEHVGERLLNTGEMPPVSLEFQDEIKAVERAIFRNGEPLSFGRCLMFMQGAYWMLGFIKNPRKRIKGKSPAEYAKELCEHWGSLGTIP